MGIGGESTTATEGLLEMTEDDGVFAFGTNFVTLGDAGGALSKRASSSSMTVRRDVPFFPTVNRGCVRAIKQQHLTLTSFAGTHVTTRKGDSWHGTRRTRRGELTVEQYTTTLSPKRCGERGGQRGGGALPRSRSAVASRLMAAVH